MRWQRIGDEDARRQIRGLAETALSVYYQRLGHPDSIRRAAEDSKSQSMASSSTEHRPIRGRSASTMPAASPRPSASSTKPVADHIGSSSGHGRVFSSTFKIETASSRPTKAASLSK
jgi:hypothetical protein